MIDLGVVGTGIGMVLTGVVSWFAGRSKRDVSDAQSSAQISDYRADQATTDAAAAQIKQLLDRVDALETKYSRLWDDLQNEKQASSKLRDRVHQLEGILRANNIPVPAES